VRLPEAAFVWDPGYTLEGLGDAVADVPVLNQPLRAHQQAALGPPPPVRVAALADIPATAHDYLLVGGQVFLTRRLVRRFVAAARRTSAPTAVLALPASTFVRSTTPLMDVGRAETHTTYAVWYRTAAGPPTPAELAEATPVVIPIREHTIPNDMLERRGLSPAGMEVALTSDAIVHICHWSHLVVANYVALFAHWFELTPGKLLRYLWAFLRALPWPSSYRFMRKLVRRGRRCKIHPSAVVEASVLGDDVEIGPGAVVRACFLGHKVKIDAHANVNQSALGDGAVVSFSTQCNLSVLYPQALVSIHGCQMAVLGRRAAALAGTILMDLRDPYLEEEVRVIHKGQRTSSGRKLLGPCIGHGTILGAGVKLAPGVVVPSGAFVVSDPETILRRPDGIGPPEARVPYVVEQGALARVRKRGE
jgi:acetyltransferase-like isoleucine patch superfamily enzyme